MICCRLGGSTEGSILREWRALLCPTSTTCVNTVRGEWAVEAADAVEWCAMATTRQARDSRTSRLVFGPHGPRDSFRVRDRFRVVRNRTPPTIGSSWYTARQLHGTLFAGGVHGPTKVFRWTPGWIAALLSEPRYALLCKPCSVQFCRDVVCLILENTQYCCPLCIKAPSKCAQIQIRNATPPHSGRTTVCSHDRTPANTYGIYCCEHLSTLWGVR